MDKVLPLVFLFLYINTLCWLHIRFSSSISFGIFIFTFLLPLGAMIGTWWLGQQTGLTSSWNSSQRMAISVPVVGAFLPLIILVSAPQFNHYLRMVRNPVPHVTTVQGAKTALDAVMVTFSNGYVDASRPLTHVIRLQSKESGTVHEYIQVLPVLYDGWTPDEPVTAWFVSKRYSRGRSTLRQIKEPLQGLVWQHRIDVPKFRQAVDKACAMHGLKVANQPLLLHYTPNFEETQASYGLGMRWFFGVINVLFVLLPGAVFLSAMD